MNIAEFLADLQAKDIKLWVENDKLRYNAPKSQFTVEMREWIAQNKSNIIEYLTAKQTIITPVSRDQPLQLSPAQQRLWFLEQLDSEAAAYNIPYAVRLTGQLNITALQNSFINIIQRHEILRTNFQLQNDQVIQIIRQDFQFSDFFEQLDIKLSETEQYLIQQVKRPFDLKTDNLIRIILIRHSDEQYTLFINIHHIISDGWSMDIFLDELTTFYEGKHLSSLFIQYADYATWQRNRLQGSMLVNQLNYWKHKLAHIPAQLDLPFDYQRHAIQTYHGSTEKLIFSAELSKKIISLAEKQQTTLFITLLTAWKILLYRHTGQHDIVVGTPIAGRNQQETENLIGFFVNTLVIRTKLQAKQTFIETLQQVKQTALEAYSHQDVPFEQLVAELQPERDLSYTPIFQVMFVFHQNEPIKTLKLKEIIVEALPEIDIAASKFNLNFHVWIQQQQLYCKLYYNTDLFKQQTIQWILSHFKNLLHSIVEKPNEKITRLSILNPDDKFKQNAIQPSQFFTPFEIKDTEQTIISRFKQFVDKYPYKIAVKTDTYNWNYKLLNQKSNCVAHHLLKTCTAQDQRIALLFEHDAPMLVGMLGVLKIGKTYVPLHIEHPIERLRIIVDDAQAGLIISQNSCMSLAQELSQGIRRIINVDNLQENNKNDPNVYISPQTPAYLLYTSGSTGQPKGVMQNHCNVLFYIRNYTNSLHISHHDRLSQFASYSFDAGMIDIFATLLNGATLYPINIKKVHLNDLAKILIKNKITIYHSTPTLFYHFMSCLTGGENFQHIRILILGGETVKKQHVIFYKKYFSDNCLFVNAIGQTESSFNSQYFINKKTELNKLIVPIGYPMQDIEILLLDEEGNDAGIYGEISIKSQHIALGYWRKSSLDKSNFNYLENEKTFIYRSGDMGRLTAMGYYEFLGRNDFQVKLRGFRIELSEIEAVLTQQKYVKNAVVTLHEKANDKALAAYVVLVDENMDISILREALEAQLPDYMVPAYFTVLDKLPLTPSGKIDRKALPEPEKIVNTNNFIAPRNEIEIKLTKIWEKVLDVSPIGINDNFFDLGGHSLLMITLLSQINKIFSKNLELTTLFQAPTIATLAQHLQGDFIYDLPASIIPMQPKGSRMPFFCVAGAGGGVHWFNELAKELAPEQPFYALETMALEPLPHYENKNRSQAQAIEFAKVIRQVQPQGPYHIGGYSYGGIVAHEMACHLQSLGEKVNLLVFLDSWNPIVSTPFHIQLLRWSRYFYRLPLKFKFPFLRTEIKRLLSLIYKRFLLIFYGHQAISKLKRMDTNELRYSPSFYKSEGRVVLFRSSGMSIIAPKDKNYGWQDIIDGKIDVYSIPGNHYEILSQPNVGFIADKIHFHLINTKN